MGRALRRPAVIPIPGFVLRLVLGDELARSTVLEGQRAVPAVLLDSGFEFAHLALDDALAAALGA